METIPGYQLSGPHTPDCKRGGQATLFAKTVSWGLVQILICATFAGCAKKEEMPRPGPPDVRVANVVQRDVPIYGEWVAQLNGPVNADITPKVQGYLLQQNYQNGFFVKKGQLLFTLDPRQYQADLEEAQAEVGVAEANLARFDADVARDTPLAAQQAIPQKDLDTDLANQAASRSQLTATKAKLSNSQLNITWTKVYSPIDGIAGVANSQVGDLVGTSTKMVTVSTVNPIWAYFNVSESLYLKFAPQITAFITGKRPQREAVPVEFIQSNDESYPERGRIVYVNRQVGTSTGTIQMAAEFANRDAALRPGGFGRIRIKIGDSPNAFLVPQAAVIEVQSDYMLLVLTPDNKARFQPVKVGDRVGPNWVITAGLKPGERVVVEGVEKVQLFASRAPELAKEGIPVIPKPYTPASAVNGSN
jgi:membrane fusion protein (multidrug efflux system)